MGCIFVIIFIFLIFWGFSVSPVLGIIILVGIFVAAIYLSGEDSKKKSKIQNDKINKLNELKIQIKDFTITQKFQSKDFNSSILLDEESKKVCFIFTNNNSPEIYDYKDILESEILEDGITITNTSRASQLGGALVGGILGGGVGVVVGGLSGKKTTEREINKIDLKVVVNNTKSPNKIINFLTADLMDFNGKPFPVKKDSSQYKSAMNSINHWHSLLSVLIKQEQIINVETKMEMEIATSVNMSVADEIKKLSDLLSQGILTQDEFNQQKQRILSS